MTFQITEAVIRNAASWQAFKEGKSLADAGMVESVTRTELGWQGVVRDGKRRFHVTVIAKSATHLDTRCSCFDNQRSGCVCAHAVATGLVLIAVKKSQPEPNKNIRVPSPDARHAWQIFLPPNWQDSLRHGKLMATLKVRKDHAPTLADEQINAWLAATNTPHQESRTIHLSGNLTSGFATALIGHAQVFENKTQSRVIIEGGDRLPLDSANRLGNLLNLQCAPDAARGCWLGDTYFTINQARLHRVGVEALPAELVPQLRKLFNGDVLEISLDQFFSQIHAWQECLKFPEDSWLDKFHFKAAHAHYHLLLDGSMRQLQAQLLVKYDPSEPVAIGSNSSVGLPRWNNDCCETRDLTGENAATKILLGIGFTLKNPTNGEWSLTGEEAIMHFVTKSLPDLRLKWSVSESSALQKSFSKVELISPVIKMKGSGNDWFDFEIIFKSSNGSIIPATEIQRMLRGASSSSSLAAGHRRVLSSSYADLIEPMLADLDVTQDSGHYRADARSGEVIREMAQQLHQDLSNKPQHHASDFELPASVQATLRPYQFDGARWLWERCNLYGGALLADDMGLGKTLQTITWAEACLAQDNADSGMVLVVATASLLGNWKAEFTRFAPNRSVKILHGSDRDQLRETITAGDVILTSYGTLARDLAWHLKRKYRAVIVDEASQMRNPDTDHAKAVAKLNASYRVALTGTPIENGVRDLWTIFRFIQPGWLGDREDFRERYEIPLATVELRKSVLERLKIKSSPFMLRRTKEQVATDLPSKILIDEFCDLTDEQASTYRDVMREGRKLVDSMIQHGQQGAARMHVLTTLLRLRQVCCDLALLNHEKLQQLPVTKRSAKLARLLERIEESIDGGHRMLVFSQFQSQLVLIEKQMQERGWPCLRLDGQTRNRQNLVDSFQQETGPPVFLISLKAGGYGLNLTAADTVVHFDPWWNPAAEAQATDRAHRIGQTRPVSVYRMLTRSTVEEKVVALQSNKRAYASMIDSESGEEDAVDWSFDDLRSMLASD